VFIPIVLLLLQAFAKPEIITVNADKTTFGAVQQSETEKWLEKWTLENIGKGFFQPAMKSSDSPQKPDNVLVILLNSKNQYLIENELAKKEEVKQIVKDFLHGKNRHGKEVVDYAEKEIPGFGKMKVLKGVTSFRYDIASSDFQKDYTIRAVGEAYLDVIQEKSKELFNIPYFSLSNEKREIVKMAAPIWFSIAEPKVIKPPAPAQPLKIGLFKNGEIKIEKKSYTSFDEVEKTLVKMGTGMKEAYKKYGYNSPFIVNLKVENGVTDEQINELKKVFKNAGVDDINVVREKKTTENNVVAPQIKGEPDNAKICIVTLSENLLFIDNKQTTIEELKYQIDKKSKESGDINTVELRVSEGTSESRIEDVNGILNRISGVKRIKKTILPQAPPPVYISINSNGELKVGNDRFKSFDEFEESLIEIVKGVENQYKDAGGSRYLVANVKVKTGVANGDVDRLKESLQKAKLQHVNCFQEKTVLQNANCKSEYFGNGLIKTFGKNGKVGLATQSGNQILANEYDEIKLYGNYIKTTKDGKYGLYTTTGNVIFKNEFGSIQYYGNYIKTTKDGKYGLYTTTGNVIFKNEFGSIQYYGNYIKTTKDGKYGLYTTTGDIILKNEYDDISLADSYLKTVKNGKVGLADSRGNILIPNEYDKLEVKGKKVRLVKNGTKKTITL